VGNRVWDGVILDENLGLEIGSKEKPIVKTILISNDSKSIHNSRITLIGQEKPNIFSSTSTFGFLMLVAGGKIDDSHLRKIQKILSLSNSIEGIFEKRYGRDSWYQVSQHLIDKGLNFFHIGTILIELVRLEYKNEVDAIELLMTINNDQVFNYFKSLRDLTKIETIKQLQDKIKTIQKLRPDCDLDVECNVCDNREICDQIRDMIVKRNKMRRTAQ
jgi:CO dehydrogenase/acetyl-CoA synthase beta subunit